MRIKRNTIRPEEKEIVDNYGEILIYKFDDGLTNIEVKVKNQYLK